MDVLTKLRLANEQYAETVDHLLLQDAAENGQHPYAIIVCCSDSRVIPERIFSASIGELFVIRVAGNVLDRHQIGSIEYAAAHLHCDHIIVLGHTGCGAIEAALSGGANGYIKFITDDILTAIGAERDPDRACCLNVRYAVEKLQQTFLDHPEIEQVTIEGAVYDIRTGKVQWL